jgi:hypothetical protein
MFSRIHASARFASSVVATVVLLAGCGGAQQQMPALGVAQSSAASHSVIVPDKFGDKCAPQHGAVRVTPCLVTLSSSNPGPVTLTVKTPNGSKGELREHDVCGSKGIATITGSGDTWTVTAGSTAGECLANFKYSNNEHKIQWGRSRIINTI